MSNSKRAAVTFDTEAGERSLRFTTNAMVRYQDKMDEPVWDGMTALYRSNASDFRRLRTIFWAAVSHDADVSQEEAGDLIDEIGLETAFRLISKAFDLAFPTSKASDKETSGGNGKAPKKTAKGATSSASSSTTG